MGQNDLWAPMYWSKYFAKTRHLGMMHHGAYFQLLGTIYMTREPLPAEEKQLALICHAVAIEELEAMRFVLKNFFELREDGYHNSKADEELAKSNRIREERSKSGRKGASVRWQADDKPMANAITDASQTDAHIHIHKQEDKTSAVDSSSIDALTSHVLFETGLAGKKFRDLIGETLRREIAVVGVDPRLVADTLIVAIVTHSGMDFKFQQNTENFIANGTWRKPSSEWDKNSHSATEKRQVPMVNAYELKMADLALNKGAE